MTRCDTCDVPVHTQYASPELVASIVYDGLDPALDPRWRESGARDVAEYARWCGHVCGVTCFRMALEHRDGYAPPLLDLARGVREYGGYVDEGDGSITGMIYAPFAAYAGEVHGMAATVRPDLDLEELREEVRGGRMAIASVHREIRRPARPAPGRGGHLVLVVGIDADDRVHLHNPSGVDASSRAAVLPLALFGSFFAGRGVTLEV